jgi:hypothetical protein
MNQVNVSAELPQPIAEGLKSGMYDRIGGAIRDVATREIVAWLREAFDSSEPVVSELLSLSAAPANANALNLALTTMQFAVVMKRLDAIQKQLKQLQEVLETIDYKIDLSFYANFRAALDLAMNTFTMSNTESRRVSAMQAINRFLEAEHHYTELGDLEIANQSQVADDYLYTVCLAYVTEAWCYLELNELETAHRRLQEGLAVLKPRFEKHTVTLLTSNPSAYLHPSLKHQIDLKKLTKVYQWLTPGIDENKVFEMQRDNFFKLAQHPEKWMASLPQAIRLPVKSRFFSQKLITELAKQLGTRHLSKRFTGLVSSFKQIQKQLAEDTEDDLFARLPETLQLIELMIEQCSRFETYLAEVQAIRELGISFQEWRQLTLPDKTRSQEATLVYITLSPN